MQGAGLNARDDALVLAGDAGQLRVQWLHALRLPDFGDVPVKLSTAHGDSGA